MSRISFRNFSFRYQEDQDPVLSDIHLEFSTDERILVLSPSGGGKSTFLLSLLYLFSAFDVSYTEGEITYDGKHGAELSRKEFLELFAVVFQSPAHQFTLLHPEEEAAFGLENLQVSPSSMQDLIDSSFRTFGFTKKETPIQHLSGGEQQVLAAASTALLGSRMMVMDEPTAHLDPPGRRRFRNSVESWLTPERGFILVEHHIDLWLDLVERIIVLNHGGEIIFDEKGTALLEREASLLSQMGIWLPKKPGIPDALRERKIPVPPSSPPMLTVKGLCAGYGTKRIIHHLDLSIPKGAFVALVGRNGCGKSTLLQSIIGLSDVQEGTIHLERELLRGRRKKPSAKHRPVYLFQNPEHQFIYPTVLEELQGSTSRKPDSRDLLLMRRLNLEGTLERSPFSLSGGEKRRLTLASILRQDHPLYLLDEPTFGQDAATAAVLSEIIGELHQGGRTIIMVSHDLFHFRAMIDLVAVLDQGRLAFFDTPQNLFSCPSGQLEQWGIL